MKKILATLTAGFIISSLFLAGCMTEPEGPVGDPTANEEQSAAAAAVVVSSILNEDSENLANFTWNLFTDTYYRDGWWHTSFSFTLSSGDSGFLGIDANFQDEYGNNQMLPNGSTTRMETIVDFDGTFWTFDTQLDADIVLARDPYGEVLTVSGAGALVFATMNLDFTINDLKIDLNNPYPDGTVTAHMSDEHLGEWDIVIYFNGTNIVELEMNNGTSTFTFTLDLSTGQIT
ncbi:hypothetical protein ACFL27_28145 [candidate division CSSED10-310 bacterium]|uniref:Lipoprotein n=1 Tax=candidate division CSSED10-310 bacterium TaxID=2855610 RepID=A0ABV6Z6K2_UNCC1